MNSIFAAQKLGVLIDAVLLGSASHSMLLQQAAHLTGGLYLHARSGTPAQRALAQYLLTSCLPDRYERQLLSAPPQGELETRARCFLTKQPLEVGFACSVCLAVFAHDKLPSCPVCATRFSFGPPIGQLKKRPRKAAAGGAASAGEAGAAAGAVTAGAASSAAEVAAATAAITLPPAPAGELAPWQVAPVQGRLNG
jgi:hypothetical protein